MGKVYSRVVQQGDTLHSIAQDVLGDVDRWVEIAFLNKLDYPFINDEIREEWETPTENVKHPGDTILIPVKDQEDVKLVPNFEISEDVLVRAFGSDLKIFDTHQVIGLTGENEEELSGGIEGDVGLIAGIENLRQALVRRLATPVGSLLRHPTYGSNLSELAGKPGTFENIHKIKIEVERVIRCDSRVEDITNTKVWFEGEVLKIFVSVKPVGVDTIFSLDTSFGEGGMIRWG